MAKSVKTLILGSLNTGKTSFINNLLYNSFEEYQESTIGINMNFKSYNIDDQKYDMCFMDPSGSERFKFLNYVYIKNINIVFFIFDLSNKKSLEDINEHVDSFNEINNINSYSFLVGCKSDKKINIDKKDIIELSKGYDMKYYEVSNKNSEDGKVIDDLIIRTLSKINFNYNKFNKLKKIEEKRDYYCFNLFPCWTKTTFTSFSFS